MFIERNKLALLAVWPTKPNAIVYVVDTDGEARCNYSLREPILGSALARLVPEGWGISLSGCEALSLRGKPFVTTELDFDTSVVTERRKVSFEDRFEQLERRIINQDAALHRQAVKEKMLRDELANARQAVIEDETPSEPVGGVETPVTEETPDET